MPVTDPAPWSRPPTAGEADGASAATADGAAADAPDADAPDAAAPDAHGAAAATADGSGAASVGKSGAASVVGAAIVCSEVTTRPVSVMELARQVSCAAAGAVVTFEGVVRDHDDGRGVKSITYSAHPVATDVMTQVAADVAAHPGLRALGVVHRVGDLLVGDTALAVAVSADHRAEAFAAASALVEQVKARLPVWKHQLFADGTAEWSNMA